MYKSDAVRIFNAALAAADPFQAVLHTIKRVNEVLQVGTERYALANYKRIIVIGAGKATARMAAAIEAVLPDEISAGLVIVKTGHQAELKRVRQLEAAHPVPDAAGVAATQQLLELLHTADASTLVICLLSGGASALLVAPVAGISLQDKQLVTALLLRAGASISELNAVRKHLSAVKGGRLAREAGPATVLTLIMSDVIGNPLDVIASGPTAPDESSFADAWAVLEKFHLLNDIPDAVRQYLHTGMDGGQPETVRGHDPCWMRVRNVLAGSNAQALAAAEVMARELGYATEILTSTLSGEARIVAQTLAQQSRQVFAAMRAGEKRCLLAGGETTVTVSGNGLGGRNQELALAFALEISGMHGIQLLSAGTDGSDGANDAAGALVDGETVVRAIQHRINAEEHLRENDSYHFFQKLDRACSSSSHFRTGPTGTNVMDMQIILIVKPDVN